MDGVFTAFVIGFHFMAIFSCLAERQGGERRERGGGGGGGCIVHGGACALNICQT